MDTNMIVENNLNSSIENSTNTYLGQLLQEALKSQTNEEVVRARVESSPLHKALKNATS